MSVTPTDDVASGPTVRGHQRTFSFVRMEEMIADLRKKAPLSRSSRTPARLPPPTPSKGNRSESSGRDREEREEREGERGVSKRDGRAKGKGSKGPGKGLGKNKKREILSQRESVPKNSARDTAVVDEDEEETEEDRGEEGEERDEKKGWKEGGGEGEEMLEEEEGVESLREKGRKTVLSLKISLSLSPAPPAPAPAPPSSPSPTPRPPLPSSCVWDEEDTQFFVEGNESVARANVRNRESHETDLSDVKLERYEEEDVVDERKEGERETVEKEEAGNVRTLSHSMETEVGYSESQRGSQSILNENGGREEVAKAIGSSHVESHYGEYDSMLPNTVNLDAEESQRERMGMEGGEGEGGQERGEDVEGEEREEEKRKANSESPKENLKRGKKSKKAEGEPQENQPRKKGYKVKDESEPKSNLPTAGGEEGFAPPSRSVTGERGTLLMEGGSWADVYSFFSSESVKLGRRGDAFAFSCE